MKTKAPLCVEIKIIRDPPQEADTLCGAERRNEPALLTQQQ